MGCRQDVDLGFRFPLFGQTGNDLKATIGKTQCGATAVSSQSWAETEQSTDDLHNAHGSSKSATQLQLKSFTAAYIFSKKCFKAGQFLANKHFN